MILINIVKDGIIDKVRSMNSIFILSCNGMCLNVKIEKQVWKGWMDIWNLKYNKVLANRKRWTIWDIW